MRTLGSEQTDPDLLNDKKRRAALAVLLFVGFVKIEAAKK